MSTRSLSSFSSTLDGDGPVESRVAPVDDNGISGEGEGATVLICADSTALSTSNSSTFKLLIGNRESVTSNTPSFGGCCGWRGGIDAAGWLSRFFFFIGSCDRASTILSISLEPLLARDCDRVCNATLDDDGSEDAIWPWTLSPMSSNGIKNENLEPSFILESTRSWPPSCSTILATTARPSPVPEISILLEAKGWQYTNQDRLISSVAAVPSRLSRIHGRCFPISSFRCHIPCHRQQFQLQLLSNFSSHEAP